MFRIVTLSLLAASQAFGCVCARFETPKEGWQRSSLVFVGRVERVTPEFERNNPFLLQRATVRVEEAFKGVQKDQLIEIDGPGSDCDLKYSKGWRRLFYLSDKSGGFLLSPGSCGCSDDPESAPDDLRFLRALPASADRTRISGEVIVSGDPNRPLSGVTVTLTKPGTPTTRVVTDAKGAFEVYDLPQGTYTVSVGIPKGLKSNFGYVSGPRTFSDEFPLTVVLGNSHATAVFYLTSTDSK